MRRLTKKITSLVLLASFTASLSSMALAADVGTVTDDCVRLRRSASTSSDPLGMLAKGDKVSILDSENDGWLKITYTDDEGSHTGYVSAEFIKTSDSAKTKKTQKAAKKKTEKNTAKASAAKTEQSADTTEDTQKAAADTSDVALGTGTVIDGGKKYTAINMRADNSKDASVLCKVPVGKSIEVLADKDSTGWYQVRYTDKNNTVYSGYMLSRYVETAVTTTPTTAATVSAVKKTNTIVNIRAEKSTDAEIVYKVPIGEVLDVVADADSEGWYQVSYTDNLGKTYNGYMREEYVDADNNTASKLTGVVKTKRDFIYIRSAKSTKADVVCKVPAGRTVTLSGSMDADGWYQVRYKDSKGTHKGYMVGKYIKVKSISTGTINTSTAVLRTAADSSSDMLAVIPEKSKVSILAVLGDWYQVEYDQQIGYVDGSCVASEATDESKGYGTVTVDTLHLRASRGTDSSIVTNLKQGDTFQISSSKKGWYGVTFNGLNGYVKAEYVSTSETTSTGYIQVTSTSLKLRSGAGTDYKQLDIVPYGTLLSVKDSIGSWYRVEYDGTTGYVCGDYASSTTSAGFQAYPDFAKITASSLALRTKSSMDAQLLCSIPEGTVVAVSGMKDGWYKVIYGTQKGYINASYTSKSNGPATVIRTETETETESSSSSSSSSSASSSSSSSSTKKSTSSSSSNSSSSSSSGSGSAVLAYAQRFVGNPYKWGGTSLTNGCDCSGFVQSVFAHFGKSLPHSSSADRGVGRGVSTSDMRVGDIVCYSGHVGIYAGGGKLLSALGKKYGITYCSVNYKKILAVRRVI